MMFIQCAFFVARSATRFAHHVHAQIVLCRLPSLPDARREAMRAMVNKEDFELAFKTEPRAVFPIKCFAYRC